MKSERHILTMLLIVLAPLALLTCGGDDDGTGPRIPGTIIDGVLTIPPGWDGTWTWTVYFMNCETDQLYNVEEITDTYVVDDTLNLVLSGLFSNSTGRIIGDSLTVSFMDTITDSLCNAVLTLVIDAARVGDTVTGTGEANLYIDNQGMCGSSAFEAGCEKIEITGVRQTVVP